MLGCSTKRCPCIRFWKSLQFQRLPNASAQQELLGTQSEQVCRPWQGARQCCCPMVGHNYWSITAPSSEQSGKRASLSQRKRGAGLHSRSAGRKGPLLAGGHLSKVTPLSAMLLHTLPVPVLLLQRHTQAPPMSFYGGVVNRRSLQRAAGPRQRNGCCSLNTTYPGVPSGRRRFRSGQQRTCPRSSTPH
jgi:hypothetical protein